MERISYKENIQFHIQELFEIGKFDSIVVKANFKLILIRNISFLFALWALWVPCRFIRFLINTKYYLIWLSTGGGHWQQVLEKWVADRGRTTVKENVIKRFCTTFSWSIFIRIHCVSGCINQLLCCHDMGFGIHQYIDRRMSGWKTRWTLTVHRIYSVL